MKSFQIILSAVTAFCILGGGALFAVLTALAGQPISKNAWAVCIVTGLVGAMKDIRAVMALPPLSNGNYDLIAQLLRNQNQNEIENPKSKIQNPPDDPRPGYTRAPAPIDPLAGPGPNR